jgi:MFS family permease
MFDSLKDKVIGPTLIIALFYSIAFSMLLYAFQPFAIKGLDMSTKQISLMFSMFGILGIISQLFILPRVMKHFSARKVFSYAIFTVAVIFGSLFFANSVRSFWIINIMLGLSNSVINPLVQTILSHSTEQKSQGTILGINSAYMSIGQIIGPILGGAIATLDLAYPFLVGSFFAFLCYFLSFKLIPKTVDKRDKLTLKMRA